MLTYRLNGQPYKCQGQYSTVKELTALIAKEFNVKSARLMCGNVEIHDGNKSCMIKPNIMNTVVDILLIK